jgi:SNF2 family DNA or RNA helicase
MMKVLEALLRLRQAACHIGMLPGQEATSSSKVSLLMSCLEKCVEGGHKALIFSQWTKFLDLIGKEMKTRSMKFLRIDGTTQKRGEIVKSFQESQEHPFLLLSLKAAGIGLNLTAADHVFIMDPWWNPAVEQQAADRSYRIGQDKPVIVHKIVTKGSVEENILKLQEKKKNLANAIIGDNNKAYKLTREDMISLFQ